MRRGFILAMVLNASGWGQTAARPFTWNKIRYRGGTVEAKVNPYDWNTTITIKADSIAFVFGAKPFRLRPAQVISLSHGVEAQRKVARIVDAIALTLSLNPMGLFGLLKSRPDHLVGIVYQTEDGKQGAILLESDMYGAILSKLENVTGKHPDGLP